MSGSRLTSLVDGEVDGMEDLTAGELFHRLRDSEGTTSAQSDAVYRELVDETPDELARNAESEPTESTVEDDVVAENEVVESLLLPDRTEADEFQWVDTNSGTESEGPEVLETDGERDPEPSDDGADVEDWDVSFDVEDGPDLDAVEETRRFPTEGLAPRDDERGPDDDAATDEERDRFPPIVGEDVENIAVSTDVEEGSSGDGPTADAEDVSPEAGPGPDEGPPRTATDDFDPAVVDPEPRSAHPRAVTEKREGLPPIVDDDPENIAVPVVKEDVSPAPPAVDRADDRPDGVLARLKRLLGNLF